MHFFFLFFFCFSLKTAPPLKNGGGRRWQDSILSLGEVSCGDSKQGPKRMTRSSHLRKADRWLHSQLSFQTWPGQRKHRQMQVKSQKSWRQILKVFLKDSTSGREEHPRSHGTEGLPHMCQKAANPQDGISQSLKAHTTTEHLLISDGAQHLNDWIVLCLFIRLCPYRRRHSPSPPTVMQMMVPITWGWRGSPMGQSIQLDTQLWTYTSSLRLQSQAARGGITGIKAVRAILIQPPGGYAFWCSL